MQNPLLTFSCLLFFSHVLFGQNLEPQNSFKTVPEAYRAHPEFGLTKPVNPRAQADFELIHLRKADSRVFSNKNGSFTTIKSSYPIHYKQENGWWATLKYEFAEDEYNPGVYHFPAEEPQFSYNTSNGAVTTLFDGHSSLESGTNLRLIQLDDNGKVIQSESVHSTLNEHMPKGNQIIVPSKFDGIGMEHTFEHGYQKRNFILNNEECIHRDASWLVFEEGLILPDGWNLLVEGTSDIVSLYQAGTDLALYSADGQRMAYFPQAVITDATALTANLKFATEIRNQGLLNGYYELISVSSNVYKLRTYVNAAWLRAEERVYPVIVDPVVIIENNEPLNTCFFPNYQEGPMVAEIPEGHMIFNTFLEWQFVAVAGSNGWTEDQRTFISGPAGSTPVYTGSGSSAGTQTYTTFTSILDGISTGTVDFSFFASRVWGGNACNATFNFISSRYVEITHDLVEFGEGDIMINEYSASNRWMLDEFGKYEDWVELYNNSSNFVDLTGYYLSDNPNIPLKWQIPGGFIPPNSHFMVYCSGRDFASGTTGHANFRLSQLKPESILLSDPDGNLLESYDLWLTQNDHSYGRMTDGGNVWGVTTTPTPGLPNENHKTGYSSKPEFSLQAGSYESTVTIQLSTANLNEQIRFTTNGHIPTVNSSLYTGPIEVTSTTVIRARSFSSDTMILPGFIETNTFLINEGHLLPVFSFSGDELNILFGGAQIETIGAYEFFDADGSFIDESVGEFDKHGNDSWSYPQRGVDFVSRDEYGYKAELEYKFFETSERTNFQRLMVKAAANDNYPFEQGGAHIRDSYVQTLSQVAGLNLDERSSTNCIVYVNGVYWGVYDLREKVDDNDFTEIYYNQERQYKGSDLYIQFLKTWGATQPAYGNQPAIVDWLHLRNFITNNNMGDESNFAYVDSLLDISSMIDYFVINSYVVSRDWLNYNTGWWRGLHPDGMAKKWRYILWDMEAALGHFTNYTGIPDVTANAAPCNVENINVGNGHAQSLKKLIQQNPKVRQMYVTRYADLLNTHLSCESVIALLDSMIAVIEPEMPRQIARWGGNMNTWQQNVETVKTFLEDRCAAVANGLLTCYQLSGPYTGNINVYPEGAGLVKMNSIWLPHYPFDATIYGNIESIFTTEGNGGYEFSHWEIEGYHEVIDSLNPELILMLEDSVQITAHFFNPNMDDRDLIYYWHFNTLETPNDVIQINADYQLIEDVIARMVYLGVGGRDIDAYNEGSDLNLHMIEDAGLAARVRNPSIGRALLFEMPTTGFEDIIFEYAVHRSGQGMLQNIISYSIDGETFVQDGLDQMVFDISEIYSMVSIDFSNIEGATNNPDFKLKIEYQGNTNQSNGNNRYDNITLKGRPHAVVSVVNAIKGNVSLYPNPFDNRLIVVSDYPLKQVSVYDLPGRLVLHKNAAQGHQLELESGHLAGGMYFVKVEFANGETTTLKVVKQ